MFEAGDAPARPRRAATMIKFPQEQRSLFGEILDWMLAPLLLLWPMSVALTWVVAENIANRPYDRELGEMARTLGRQVVAVERAKSNQATVRLDLSPVTAEILRDDDVDNVYFLVLGRRGEYVSGDRDLPVAELRGQVGVPQFRNDRMLETDIRVASLWLALDDPGGGAQVLVQVAETLGKRSALTTEIIKGVILPQFVVLPMAVVLVWFALARGLAPLNSLQQVIRKREAHDLSPLDEQGVPEEVTPLVSSMNDLLSRLGTSISAQKHFLADAAHQLKTPLAGLRTQAELAQRDIDRGDIASARRSMQHIARSSQRAAHMVNQLLSLARSEDEEQSLRLQDVNLLRLATDVVEDFLPAASAKRIDLGMEGADGDAPLVAAWVRGQPVLVRELIRNLVDNAIHYAPIDGRVTVRVLLDPFGHVALLQVEDDGPGIPEAERELVFQAFYRSPDNPVEGSGLGLAIVREVVSKHQATITVEDTYPRSAARPSPGARFTIRWTAVDGPEPTVARREPAPISEDQEARREDPASNESTSATSKSISVGTSTTTPPSRT
jgi:two-component system sensor histidine kinase TctE